MSALFAQKRILIVVGAGGVGKTTTSAAIGLLAARLGYKTLVMTIDPAKRLAASLGLSELSHEPRTLSVEKADLAHVPSGGFFAMTLDPKQTFDEFVRREATDPATVKRIFANRIYHELSTRLAGGQEYAAVEKLYELHRRDEYDVIVLDTPPATNAIDFLDAPEKLVRLLESPLIKMLTQSYRREEGISFKLLTIGATYLLKKLSLFIGKRFLDDLAHYFSDLETLLGGFQQRAAHVLNLFSDADVGFVFVTSPNPEAIDEIVAFQKRLEGFGISPWAVIVNRVHPLSASTISPADLKPWLVARGLTEGTAMKLIPHLLTAHRNFQILAKRDAEEIARLKRHCGEATRYSEIPLLDQDVVDVEGLLALSRYMT